MKVSQRGHEKTRVETYSDFDPIDVTNVVMDLLQYFDGRPVPIRLTQTPPTCSLGHRDGHRHPRA